MVLIGYRLLGGLLCSIAYAQTYPANTNTGCVTASDISYQAVYIYSSSDRQNLGFYTQSQGTCDGGSYARVHFVDPNGNDIDCGYVALDGTLHLVQCPGTVRGQLTEGQYTVYWETVPQVGQYSFNEFSISHSQKTETAPTPTSTVTTTPTSTVTQTSTTALTETFTSKQITVTLPSSTVTNTVLVTPSPTSTIQTSTRTLTRTRFVWTRTIKTTSYPTPCRPQPLVPCKKGGGCGRKRGPFVRDDLPRLSPRDDNVGGMPGSPATVTETPPATISTSTAPATTSTVTVTSQATPNASITLANPTPTTTAYFGSAVSSTTSTLPQVTSTITKTTSAVVTTTRVLTITVLKVTPYSGPCLAKTTSRAY